MYRCRLASFFRWSTLWAAFSTYMSHKRSAHFVAKWVLAIGFDLLYFLMMASLKRFLTWCLSHHNWFGLSLLGSELRMKLRSSSFVSALLLSDTHAFTTLLTFIAIFACLFRREMGYAACPLNRPDFQNSTVANRQRRRLTSRWSLFCHCTDACARNYFSISVNVSLCIIFF